MNRNDKLFSIIVPSYNYAHYLPDTIQSVLRQPGDDYELIVINDGSTDNTDEVAKSLLAESPDSFRYFTHENQGLSGTRNAGIELAYGKYLFFLDSDDKLTSEALVYFRKAIQQHSSAQMIIGRYNSVTEDGRVKPRCLWSLKTTREANFKQYLLDSSVYLLCSAVLFRRDIFADYQFPTHIRQCEDEPVFALAFANAEVVKINGIVANILKHDDSLRNQVFYGLSDMVIKEIFDPSRLPEHLMKYEMAYRGHRYLDQFRTLFYAGEYEQAWQQYREAFSYNKSAALQLNYLRKAVRAWLRK